MTPLRIAIMQPYFIPYLGYFRLFAATDLFVIYDCVQFPRRGWVHRNKLIDNNGRLRWLTLPIQKATRDVLIQELRFSPDAPEVFGEQLRQFSVRLVQTRETAEVLALLRDLRAEPPFYIVDMLEAIVRYLNLPWNVVRSSSLNVPASFRGQERIMEICRRLGAMEYINSPGGRDLYSDHAFAAAGIRLSFLPEYTGPFDSVLGRVMTESREQLTGELLAELG